MKPHSGLNVAAVLAAALGAVYLAVLPMSGTIALRNLALFLLLLVLAGKFRHVKAGVKLGWPFLLWASYLLIFIWIADDHQAAWQNFVGQWGRSLLALLAGAGLAALLSRSGVGTPFHLGLISAVPILVHLVLVAWQSWESGGIAWNYWGRETHHADLGYAAGQTVVLLATGIIFLEKSRRFVGVALIVAALMSTALAGSRAGLAFAILGVLSVFLLANLYGGKYQQSRRLRGAFLLMFIFAGAIFFLAVKNDPSWRSMVDQLEAGLLGDALKVQCEGTASVEPLIKAKHGEGKYADHIIRRLANGDGSRVGVLRVGFYLALRNPWGSDGSRHAYQTLLRQECAEPASVMVHAHNGWIDSALAIGWLGPIFYLLLLVYCVRAGLTGLRQGEPAQSQWALVLAAMSIFWLLRGLTDSVFRDHMLEMQGFVLAYAFVSSSLSRPKLPATH